MALGFRHGVAGLAWTTREPSGHFARAVLSYLWNQIENGTGCPTGMAYAACAGFAGRPQFALWRERTLSGEYDPRRLPLTQKTGAVIGYAMTEKQGGSDLRQTQTTATFVESENGAQIYSVTGHKWFFSVPTSDGFYTLAQTQSGVSCLFVPRFLPDGSLNRVFLQRLKDKCGNRSNASSEVEFNKTWAMLVGEEGRGIREILSHAHLTRLDFAVGSAGLMRQALTLAIGHASTRDGFGRCMADLPMQTNVLADLALESEAAMLSALRVARATDSARRTSSEEYFLGCASGGLERATRCAQAGSCSPACGSADVVSAAVSAVASSCAVWYRSPGSLASAVVTIPSIQDGRSFRTDDGLGGSSVKRLTKPSFPAKGGLPVSISNSTQPRL